MSATSPLQAVYRLWIGYDVRATGGDLTILLACARSGSLTGAASGSGVTLATAGMRLGKLDERLGARHGIDAAFNVWVAHQPNVYGPRSRHRRSTQPQASSVLDRIQPLAVACPSCGRNRVEILTERQLDCLWLYGRTGSIATAARILGIGEGTVRRHLRLLNRSLGTQRSVQAIYRLWIGDRKPELADRDLALLLAYARTGSLTEAARRRSLPISTAKRLVNRAYRRVGAIGVVDLAFSLWVADRMSGGRAS